MANTSRDAAAPHSCSVRGGGRVEAAARLVLIVSAVIVAWQGLRYLVNPASVVANAEISTSTIDERHVLRAGYGGGLVGVAIVSSVAAFRQSLRSVGLWTMTIAMAALVAGRLVSVAVDGRPSGALLGLLAVEAVILAANIGALAVLRWQDMRRPPRPRAPDS